MKSMFDDLCTLYPLTPRSSTANPMDCMDICRKIALSAWTARLRFLEAQIASEQYTMMDSAQESASIATWLDQAWTKPWQPRAFGRLVRARLALESIEMALRINMDAMGIGTADAVVEGWEADAWQRLQMVLQSLQRKLETLWQAYNQAVAVRESISSNNQGRQVGYLTSIATIFIPASLVAAIFSMGGDFAVGGSRNWVYFAVSVPIMVLGLAAVFSAQAAWFVGRVAGRVTGIGRVGDSPA